MTRIFLAHSSSADPKELRAQAGKLLDLLQEKFKTKGDAYPTLQVVLGREDHRRHWAGNWEAWQASIVDRQDFMTGHPVYSIFVVPDGFCGRATAGILNRALKVNRPVMWWDGESRLERVSAIHMDDPDDWSSGFRVDRGVDNEDRASEPAE